MVDNTVTIVGNLTADPEIRVTDGGATLAEIRIAQNKNKELRMDHGNQEIQCFFKGLFGMTWQKMLQLLFKKV